MPPAGLQFEQAPPISVPFRFFLSAPIFLLLAAALLLWRGPEIMTSRLSPAALAATHLFTLGFAAMVVLGAVMQMLPVLAGAPIRRPRMIATIVHAGISVGTLSLAAGFLFDAPLLLRVAVVALSIGFGVFVAAVVTALWRSRVRNRTVNAMRLAILSLVATVALGLLLVSNLGWGAAPPSLSLSDLHPGWGLLGWIGLLVMGVAYQVVPMFQMTPPYPASMMKYLGTTVFALLLLWSIALWFGEGIWTPLGVVCALALVIAYTLFAVTTLRLQHRRRRRQADVTLDFWRIGLGTLMAALVLWALRLAAPFGLPGTTDTAIGILALLGFAGCIINGMLYKIMPFLAWFHLQALTGAGRLVPNMKQILNEAAQRLQFRVHVAALALFLASAASTTLLIYPAALALGASAGLLAANLLKVVRTFRATLAAYNAHPPSA